MPKKNNSNKEGTTVRVDGRELTLTNLDKVLYPASGFRKAQVIDYYVRAARFLLPHLMDRPVSLKRYPDNVLSTPFWEKNAPTFTPDWVKTFPVPRHSSGPPIRYILINDTSTLAWVANAAALELHPFLHRAPDIQTPTSLVFDLDPGEGAGLTECIRVAQLLKGMFDGLGLRLFPKVSGSKGLQVYAPLNTQVTYPVTQAIARSMARLIESEHPKLAVSDMAKVKRSGKVFVDWSQNSDFKTTVSVYSLRAKHERPYVSMPVTWEELERALKSKRMEHLFFEPEQALARMEKAGDLFADVETLKQTLPESLIQSAEAESGTKNLSSALHEYQTKRDFSRTEEPAAKPILRRSRQGSLRRFVVQKHAASRLHYDFRLEMGGVLKSWAVPKGVPFEIGTPRLASATEDHPLEYLDFEGVIPEGQYGGGTVMVWDIGVFEIMEGNYWKGFLHFHLKGKKLKGEWTLRRSAERGKNAWTLEKAGTNLRALSAKKDDSSALTGRTMAQIAKARDREWQSNRKPKAVEKHA